MENPLLKAYQVLDDSIMWGAEAAAGTYNWTTGGTKDELANLMSSTASVFGFLGFISNTELLIQTISPINFALYIDQKRNTRYTKLEIKAIERGAKSLEAEGWKNSCKFNGYLSGVCSLALIKSGYSAETPRDALSFYFIGTLCILNTASGFVMRTDYKPPRKNVLRRAGDAIVEAINEYRKPALQPVRTE